MVIRSCVSVDPSVGYRTARKFLEERFRHPLTIAAAYMKGTTEGALFNASDTAGLLTFADQLKNSESTLKTIGYLDEFKSVVPMIWRKLSRGFSQPSGWIKQTPSSNLARDRDFIITPNSSRLKPGLPTTLCLEAALLPGKGIRIWIRGWCQTQRREWWFNIPGAFGESRTDGPCRELNVKVHPVTSIRGRVLGRNCPSCNGNHELLTLPRFKEKIAWWTYKVSQKN